ncbi:MAG: O-antigen ligase family protein [Phycisphaeraceae bacterium]
MKQLFFLISLTALAGVATFVDAFWAILLYYGLAVLRPQYLWKWALSGDYRWSLVAAAIVFAGVFMHGKRIMAQARLTAVFWLLLAYTVLVMLSCLTSHDPAIAQQWAIEYGKIFLIAALASLIIHRLEQIRLVAMVIVIAVGYIAWQVNSLYFLDGRLDIFHYGIGGLDNNGAGLYLATALPLTYIFAFGATRPWQRALAVLAALLMIHALMMTYSRGAMLAAVVGAAWLLLRHRPRWQAGGIAIALILVIGVLAGAEIRDRFTSSANFQTDGSAQLRFESWDAAWRMAWENPLLGTGIRNSNQFSHAYGADQVGRTIHSLYLQIAADSGLPAMAVYIALLSAAGVSLFIAHRACQERLDDDEAHDRPIDQVTRQAAYLSGGTQAALVTFAVGGLFLSVEVVELPWILIVLAGVLPRAVEDHLEAPALVAPVAPLGAPAPTPGRGRTRLAQLTPQRPTGVQPS